MHFNFPFSVLQILWVLTFAAHLVLLVVLLGRDRIRTFPWFTANIVMVALRLLVSRLLFGRLPQMEMTILFIIMADVGAFLGLMVVVEIARRAFATAKRSSWLVGALVAIAIGAVVLRFWGAWPDFNTFKTAPPLQTAQLLAQKGMLLADLENIVVGLMILLLGRLTGAGFRSKVQQVAIGLMTASISQLSIQAIWETIAKTAVAHNRQEYEHILGLREKLFNTNNAVYIAVLIWWIVCLWIDEKKTVVGVPTSDGELISDRELPLDHVGTGGRELPRGPEVDPLAPPPRKAIIESPDEIA